MNKGRAARVRFWIVDTLLPVLAWTVPSALFLIAMLWGAGFL